MPNEKQGRIVVAKAQLARKYGLDGWYTAPLRSTKDAARHCGLAAGIRNVLEEEMTPWAYAPNIAYGHASIASADDCTRRVSVGNGRYLLRSSRIFGGILLERRLEAALVLTLRDTPLLYAQCGNLLLIARASIGALTGTERISFQEDASSLPLLESVALVLRQRRCDLAEVRIALESPRDEFSFSFEDECLSRYHKYLTRLLHARAPEHVRRVPAELNRSVRGAAVRIGPLFEHLARKAGFTQIAYRTNSGLLPINQFPGNDLLLFSNLTNDFAWHRTMPVKV